jgi:hypothetical protein
MKPAFSVVFLTTLSGAGQGLLIALFGVEVAARFGMFAAADTPPQTFFVIGAALAVVLGGLGLLASFFHLGHPERAWRAIAMWRTSWLSRECLALPVFLACAFAYGVAHWFGSPWSVEIGALGVIASAVLFVCTSMIYACLRFLQEWATPLTMVNFVLLGCASGFTFATACAAWLAPSLVGGLARGAEARSSRTGRTSAPSRRSAAQFDSIAEYQCGSCGSITRRAVPPLPRIASYSFCDCSGVVPGLASSSPCTISSGSFSLSAEKNGDTFR